jgi:hypothetical protein
MTRLSVLAIALVLAGQIGLHAQASPPASLQITILEGEGALNNIKQQTAREPIVEVQDENHRPVAGALVIFSLPQSGPSGAFAGGSTVFNGVTDANGHATATGLIPNKIVGKYQIQVNVKYHNLSAHTSINQSNFMGANVTVAHVATHAFPLKAVLIVAAAAGAAAVAVVATHGGGSNSAATITPGTATVTAPSLRVPRT